MMNIIQRNIGNIEYKKNDKQYKPTVPKQIEGFDTETERGYVRVISTSQESAEINDALDMMQFLTQKKFRGSLNVFYNLQFDSEAILKWFPELLQQLKDNEPFNKDADIKVKLIPKKYFSITKNGNVYGFYDIAQFFNMSLKNASVKYLGQKTSELKKDRENLFKKYTIDQIKDYCRDDATKTKLLAEYFINSLHNIGIFTNRIYSAGYISQIYTINHARIPDFLSIPFKVQQYYYAAYRGGWFDTYKRGVFECSNYDLKSAYPWTLSTIPDPTLGKWIEGYNSSAECGVYRVRISGGEDIFNPVSININGKNIYPIFDKKITTYLTKNEIDAYKDHYKIEILDGYSFIADQLDYPYLPLVTELFKLKSRYEHDQGTYDTVKRIINSLYGKCAQKLNQSGRCGRLFNPFFAAECTARCRTRIFNDFYNIRDKIASVMTDGILLEGNANLKIGKQLGEWDKKYHNKNTLIIQTGVYQSEKCDPHTRGFSIKKPVLDSATGKMKLDSENLINLFDYLQDKKESTFTVYQFRPLHFRECIAQKMFKEICCFRLVKKEIDLNYDLKRIWDTEIKQASQLLKQQFNSISPCISMW